MSVLNDMWGSIHDAGAPVLGYDTYAQQEANQRAERAEEDGKNERAELGERNRALRDDIDGYDDPSITSTENWSGYSHEDIHGHNQSIDEGRAGETARAWQKLGKDLRERGPDFDSKLKSIIAGGWQGEAADKASTVGEPVRKWMEGSGGAFEMTGNRLEQAASGAGQAKQMVPEPQGHSWGRSVVASIPLGASGASADAVAQMRERREAEKQAREAMDRVYSKTLTSVDSGIPRFRKPDGSPADPPPATPQDPTEWGGGGGGPGGGGGGAGSGGGSGGGSGRDGGSDIADGGSIPSVPSTPSPEPTPAPPGPTTPDGPAESDSSWNTPPPNTPNTPSGPGGPGGPSDPGGSGRQSPGGGGFVGAPGGVGGGAGAGAGGTVGAGGRSGAGATGGARAAGGMTGASGAAAGARGGAGRGMLGGMGGMGQRGRGGEDEEHEHPSWLEELDDVWFNDMPRTAPPVLGE